MTERILMAHGSGGKLSHELITRCFVGRLANQWLSRQDDAACIDVGNSRFAFTTDSYVVSPLVFPGGNIGKLAVCGTVNDLAVSGAVPQYLSLAFILEEGLPFDVLEGIVESIRSVAEEASVHIVTGDTKVVPFGKADGLFINTAGVGHILAGINVSGDNVRAGDAIIISGSIGDHGMAIMAQREGLRFEGALSSDCAPLNGLISAMLQACPDIHCMRDPTRGGVATTLNEIASQSQVGMFIEAESVPVQPAVRALSEILGIDPLYIANEGKVLVFAPAAAANDLLKTMRSHKYGRDATIIGKVTDTNAGQVVLRSKLGTSHVLAMLAGDILPRIC
ncbi:MAG: hydrogenase expression/formation protein HypE [Dehalococcoidia bacterium]|nr:hydrogenase expression/formation protein HypE [Dehalococcoidia bacterium]